MVLQETFGEFSSTEKLRSLIRLICQLPGTYEVLIQTGEGEEGILHCANDTIRNAACRNLSGVEALSVILSWPRGKYWLEELPVLPTRSINLPLDRLFTEAEKINPELKAASSKAEDKTKGVSTASKPEAKGAPAALKEPTQRPEEKPSPTERLEPVVGNTESQPEPVTKTQPKPEIKKEVSTENEPVTVPSEKTLPGKEDHPKPSKKADDLPHRIASIDGVKGVIVTSVDGMLLSEVSVESNNDLVQMVALLGEALEQIGEVFAKGKFKHGSIDMGAERILLHSYHQSYIGTFITPRASAAVVGGEIEAMIAREGSR